MSKRAPGSNLNQDNWDQDEAPAEQGTWNRAGESTLKQRVIMRAKRRGTGATTSEKPSAFGGLSSKISKPASTGAFSFSTTTASPKVEEPVEKKKEEPKDVKTSDDEIKQLNLGVLKWIRLCLDNDPICDLRPVFEDYKKYIDKLDKLYGTTWVDGEVVPTETTSVTAKSPPPQKIATPQKSPSPPPKSPAKEPAKPSFSFGAPKEAPKEEKKAPVFSFGAKTEEKPKDTPVFSFSGSSAATDKKDDKPAGGFFSNLGGAPKPGGFSFGAGTSSGGFSFGGGATKPAETAPTSSGAGDEEYVPPEAEKAEFDDAKDALFHQKAKVFYMKDKAYKEIGVGQLFVKPINDDKASILVRADNTLGNILLNVTIPNAPAPSAMGKKDCMLSVVLNPPVDGVEGAVPLLIRVKTPEDRDSLVELIKSKQN